MTLIAYHGQQSVKDAILSVLAAHREADRLIQGYGYWRDGKGCAVGCTIGSGDHAAYETMFGVPQAIAHLEDKIFEGLPVSAAREWPERLMSAIQPGADLTRVQWRFLHWLLTTSEVNPGIAHPLVADAVAECARIMLMPDGEPPVAARSAAESAARSVAASATRNAARSVAASATWSAARSVAASATRNAAASAAWSVAASAAESAAWSVAASAAEIAATSVAASAAEIAATSVAASAAESAAWAKMADRLIELICEAPAAAH